MRVHSTKSEESVPRYDHDPSTVSASIFIFPKGEYEFKVGRPKSFERTAAKGHQSYGIRFPIVCTSGSHAGKKSVFSMYLHSEGAAGMGKRFQIAAAGYEVNDRNEKQFDQEAAGKDWSYDTDTGEVGQGWLDYEGVTVVCDVEQQPSKDAEGKVQTDARTGDPIMQQVWGTWRPLEGAAEDRQPEVGSAR